MHLLCVSSVSPFRGADSGYGYQRGSLGWVVSEPTFVGVAGSLAAVVPLGGAARLRAESESAVVTEPRAGHLRLRCGFGLSSSS